MADWLPFPDAPDTRLRLVCCAHSGAGIAPFARWRRSMPAGVALCPVRRPGRESRLSEPGLTDVHALAAGVVGALARRPRRPTVMLGHSLGGMVAYEVSRILQATGSPPLLLIVSGRHAPRHGLQTRFAKLPDDAFIDAIARRYGGIPDAVRAEPDLMALVRPTLRADFTAAESYVPAPGAPWAGPTWVLRGAGDSSTEPDKVDDWKTELGGPVDIEVLPGDHFFPFDAASGFLPALLTRLNAELKALG